MERRLGAALAVAALPTISMRVATDSPPPLEPLPAEASEAVGIVPGPAPSAEGEHGSLFGDDAPWPTDEARESAFMAEAKARGEPTGPSRPVAPRDEAETDTTPLPQLDELVQRIPEEVRELLEELYRVKFTAVRRVPAKALK